MYVSMTPHGESGKVLHCSQNDGSERKWELKLYDQQGVIDGTEGQTVFPVTVGGTEEVTSEGLSTPIIADIEYPDETRNDQIFTERTSPTTEDGNAEIKRLKGSSLVFNQKAWQEENAVITSIKGNTIKFNQQLSPDMANGGTNGGITYAKTDDGGWLLNGTSSFSFLNLNYVNGVNRFLNGHKYCIFGADNDVHIRAYGDGTQIVAEKASSFIMAISQVYTTSYIRFNVEYGKILTNKKIYPMIFDLTAMGIDSLSTTAEVEEWLSTHLGNLEYFGYTPGTLIPFMGAGLKTENASQTESNTLSLPISTYFPTGMKSAGEVYDELTENKAITRIGSVDLGSLTWEYDSANSRFKSTAIDDIKAPSSASVIANAVCSKYPIANYSTSVNTDKTMTVIYQGSAAVGQLWVHDSSYTSAADFKSAMSGVYLYYELATPTSQDISLDLTYPVWNGGTERILPTNGSTPTTSAFKGTIKYPDGTEETEFLYKQTKSGVLINGHSYITRINNVWSNVQGTGQTISYGKNDMIIDLTQMSASYITNYSQFIEYFDGNYDFNKGQLVSFTGEKINGVALPQFTNGMKSVNTTYDEFAEASKTVRIGMRAYQNGDENNSNVLTDMTSTLYILDDPVITYFMTASLICKGIEMPINNGIVECDTRVSEEAGMFPAKVKLSDGNDVAYSEKLSIYVERKPE